MLETMNRTKVGSNLDLRKFVNNNEITNKKMSLENIPKEQIYRLIQRLQEMLKSRDPA
jgi:hypothetical protein